MLSVADKPFMLSVVVMSVVVPAYWPLTADLELARETAAFLEVSECKKSFEIITCIILGNCNIWSGVNYSVYFEPN
jgi:hypothetical protein